MTKRAIPTQLPKERAILVGVELVGDKKPLSIDDSLEELKLLAETAGLTAVGEARQKVKRPDAKTFVGSGKVKEIKMKIILLLKK